MDNFNLIPKDLRQGKKRKTAQKTAFLFIAVFVFSFLILNVLLTVSRVKTIPLQKEAEQLQTGMRDYERLKEEIAGAETLLQSYEIILSGRTNVGKILEDLHTTLPQNIWLNEVEIRAGKELILKGYTSSLEGLGDLTDILTKQEHFESCQLDNVEEEEHGSQPFLMFSITCKLFP